jgi:hypothetical protein
MCVRTRLTWRNFELERIALVTVAAMATTFVLVFWDFLAYDDAEGARHTALATIVHYITGVIAWPLVVAGSGSTLTILMDHLWLVWLGTGLLWAFALECAFVAAGLKWRAEES